MGDVIDRRSEHVNSHPQIEPGDLKHGIHEVLVQAAFRELDFIPQLAMRLRCNHATYGRGVHSMDRRAQEVQGQRAVDRDTRKNGCRHIHV